MLLIVPASGSLARGHFERTIARAWSVEGLRSLVPRLDENLTSKLVEVDSFRIWGAVPGSLDMATWSVLEDWWVAFYQEGYVTCWGKVFAKVRDRRLAERLWGVDSKGRTWEYVYFIKDIRWCRIPWDRVREELGYQEGFIPRGHTPVSIDRLRRVLEKYGSIEGFLEALSSGGSVAERYNAYLLQGPWMLREKLELYLKALGLVAARLAERNSWTRGSVEELIREEGVKLRLSIGTLEELTKPRLLNDLRRLGLLLAGNPEEPWREGDGETSGICRAVSVLNRVEEGLASGAATLELSLTLNDTPCIRTLRDLRVKGLEGVIEDVARAPGISRERAEELLKLEEKLLDMAEEVLLRAPRCLLPVELWGEAEEADIVLASGKSLLLAGAPAVGKTRYARRLALKYTGCEPTVVTGRGDLSYDHLVYSYELVGGSSKLTLGRLALSVLASWVRLFNGRPPRWMFIDELNRFNVDLVLGELFTALDLEHRLSYNVLPGTLLKKVLDDNDLLGTVAEEAEDEDFKASREDVERALKRLLEVFRGAPLPLSWRALATINLVDRTHLFRLGFALLRRFPILLYPSVLGNFEVAFSPPDKLEDKATRLLDRLTSEFMEQAVKELSLENKAIRYDRAINVAKKLKDVKEEALKSYEGALKTTASIAAKLINTGVEVGAGLLVDTCKLVLTAKLTGFDEAQLADLIISSILLPQVGSLVPTVKAEVILMGNSARIHRVNKIMATVKDLLGSKSRSASYVEVLRLELPLTT